MKIGGVECVVTSSVAEKIECTVGNGELGQHSVSVVVQGKGKASGDFTFTQKALFSQITPLTSTLGGKCISLSSSAFVEVHKFIQNIF